MNFSKLKYFKVLCDTKSYTRAAELSFISQPALSIAIHNLEDELGVKLFEKNGTSVTLTDSGERLSPLIERVLADVDCIYKEVSYISGSKNCRVRLGVPQFVDTDLLRAIKTQFSKVDGNVEITIVQYAPNTAESELSSGHLDLCILPKAARMDNISYVEYLRQELCLYVSASHPFFNQNYITPAMLSAGTTIISTPDRSLVQCIRDYARENGAAVPQFTGDIYNKWTAMQMITSENAAVFPKCDTDYHFCRQIAFDPPMYQDFFLAWCNDAPPTSVQAKLYNFIKRFHQQK